MNRDRTAIVVGGSLGGLMAANLLLRAGWDVHVHERAAEKLQGRGAGIVTHPELFTALVAAGVAVDDSLGVKVERRVTLADDGRRAGSCHLAQVLTAWSRLFHLLRAAFPDDRYHNGSQLVDFAQEDGAVNVTFADGRCMRADLLVAADGIRSAVRQRLLPDVQPRYAGYVAWRGLVDELALSDAARTDLFPFFAFGLPPHEQMIGYPVAGPGNEVAAGKRRYNFVWYRPADEATVLRGLLTDATGKLWADGIPPPLIRPDVLAGARQAARDVLAPQWADVVDKTESLFFQPIHDLECGQMVFGRVALLGDAAFVARPHCGMGVTKAAGDAAALAEELCRTSDVPAALVAYAGRRVPFGRAVVAKARNLGAYMQAQTRTPQEREMAERYRSPQAVMQETAVPFDWPAV